MGIDFKPVNASTAAHQEMVRKAMPQQFDPKLHPRYPRDTAGGMGGKFAPKPGERVTLHTGHHGTLQGYTNDGGFIRAHVKVDGQRKPIELDIRGIRAEHGEQTPEEKRHADMIDQANADLKRNLKLREGKRPEPGYHGMEGQRPKA